MFKKIIIAAAVLMLSPAAARAAEFYDDLEISGSYVSVINGCAYSNTANVCMMNIDCSVDGDTAIFSHGRNILVMREGTSQAELNGTVISLDHTLIRDEGLMYPVRDVVEALGGHVSYLDLGQYVYSVFGKNVEAVSGTIGDSVNGWSLTLPEGFYCMTPEMDAKRVLISNFKGIDIYIRNTMESEVFAESSSINFEHYLKRREFYRTEGSSSGDYDFCVTGGIGTVPTQENRDVLNGIIDSFKPYFEDGAHNISHMNEDGSAWLYCDPNTGIEFELPKGSISDSIIYPDQGLSDPGCCCEPLHMIYMPSVSEEMYVQVETMLVEDMNSEELVYWLREYCNYYGDTNVDDVRRITTNSVSAYVLRADEDVYVGNVYNRYFWLAAIDAGEKSRVIFATPKVEHSVDNFFEEMSGLLERLIGTATLSEPASAGVEIGKPLDWNAPQQEIAVGGFKFTVPGYLKIESRGEYGYEISGDHKGLWISEIPQKAPTEETKSTRKNVFLGMTDINGHSFEVYKYEGYMYNYQYYGRDDGICIQLYMPEGREDTPYVRDLYWVMTSMRE